MQTNATCVAGISLAHRLPCTSGRVTTQRSAVVTRPHSIAKCEWRGRFFCTRQNARGITASLLKKSLFSAMTRGYTLSILAAHSGFIRSHCGKVATKAPSGRETGASAKAAILSQTRAASRLSIFDIGQCERYCPSSSSGNAIRPVFSRRRVPVVNREYMQRWPLAVVVPCSFSINRRIVLPTSKEVLSHSKNARARARWIAWRPFSTENKPRCL